MPSGVSDHNGNREQTKLQKGPFQRTREQGLGQRDFTFVKVVVPENYASWRTSCGSRTLLFDRRWSNTVKQKLQVVLLDDPAIGEWVGGRPPNDVPFPIRVGHDNTMF